ncbi:leucine-rich repeat-containing protein 14-like [Trichosurus vulpecula]|uniref:leucine-rich repeat-containing protein 14-like n=1 Tax=Trichosurus vulpecula TaxID=9337 RepID=UPI00186B4C16|nr:leucine-rich repeat-containing protein 14-like [Trichosurus vulpecula]
MQSLVTLCAVQVTRHQKLVCRALASLPRELYPVLFQAAFMYGRTLVLQALVQTWPFPSLSFRQLLPRPSQPGWPERPRKESMQAVILALLAMPRSRESSSGGPQLRVLDITGFLDGSCGQDPTTMSMWARSVALARTCLSAQAQVRSAKRMGKRRKVGPQAPVANAVEVHTDLLVNQTSYSVMKEALQISAWGPLRLRCRDFWAEELSGPSTVSLLELLDPVCLRQVDLRFNNLGLSGLCAVVPHMTKFTHLLSLKLQYSNVDVQRLTTEAEGNFQLFVSAIAQLNSLKELNLGSSRLSGRLHQLLSSLQGPLESLELPFCSLLSGDLSYLAQSPHATHLKKLNLSGNKLSGDLLAPFQRLLREASGSLLCLDITECQLMDVNLITTLPDLCSCTHLRYLGLYGNPLGSAGVKNLIERSQALPELQLVVHPVPVDCYKDLPWPPSSANLLEGTVDEERLASVQAELQQLLQARQRHDVLWSMDIYGHNSFDYFSL